VADTHDTSSRGRDCEGAAHKPSTAWSRRSVMSPSWPVSNGSTPAARRRGSSRGPAV